MVADFQLSGSGSSGRPRRPNGDRLFYYEKDNYFGVTAKDGAVKTFFRPDRGVRYWNRQ